MLRIAIKPRFNLVVFLVQIIVLGVFFALRAQSRWSFHERMRDYAFLALASLVLWIWFQLSGAEEIEFDGQRQVLTIRRSVLRWPHTSEYPLESVSALETHYGYDDKDPEPECLSCRVGNRTVRFAKGISAEQADEMLAALQSALPEISHRLLAGNDPFGKHFTTLKLN